MNIGNKITWDISRENLAVLKGSVYQNQTTECYMHTTKTCLLVFFFFFANSHGMDIARPRPAKEAPNPFTSPYFLMMLSA